MCDRVENRRAWVAVAILAGGVVGCGQRAAGESDETASAGAALQGGTVDAVDRAVVGILAQRTAGRQICSGTLIASNVVITARHCVAETFPDVVRCGHAPIGRTVSAAAVDVMTTITTDNSLPDDAGAHHAAREIRVVPGGDDACGFDLAAIVLADAVPRSEATPIVPRFDPPVADGEAYSAFGFGATCSLTSGQEKCYLESGTRRRVDGLKVQCAEQCPDWTFAATEFQGDDDLCEGDSGGPALDAMGQLIGIGSRGSADADGSCVDGVYVRVAAWREFLTTVVREGAGDGGTDVPAWAQVDAGEGEEAGETGEIEASADDADVAEGGEDCGTNCPKSREGLVAAGGCALARGSTAGSGGLVFLGLVVVIAYRPARSRRKSEPECPVRVFPVN
jgi:hypothetical protein